MLLGRDGDETPVEIIYRVTGEGKMRMGPAVRQATSAAPP